MFRFQPQQEPTHHGKEESYQEENSKEARPQIRREQDASDQEGTGPYAR
jgi:hypothetical protein